MDNWGMKLPGKARWPGTVVMTLFSLLTGGVALAQDGAEMSGVTAQDLLNLLVDEGVIDKEKLKSLSEKVQARQRAAKTGDAQSLAAQPEAKPADTPGVVRVPYVPAYIRDQIRDEVRMGLKEDVSRDVLAQAKQERWGLPGALPDWIGRIRLYGDMRVREESIFYGSGNVEGDYADIAHINSVGGLDANDPNVLLNTTENRNRLRARLRLGLAAQVNDRFEVGARIVSGNENDPVSTNQTLGNYGQKWQTSFDLGYLKYTNRTKSLTLAGGRFDNPFFSTDLVWDYDLTFEGVAGSWWLLRSDGLDEEFRSFDPFITAGAFPIREIELSSKDRWLFGTQVGFQYDWSNQNKLTAALGYYRYTNLVGKPNTVEGDHQYDYTAPEFLQKGNTLFNIAVDDFNTSKEELLFANAADYKLIDLFAQYDIANFAPLHVLLTLEYVKNIGFDKRAVAQRVGAPISAKTDGYQATVAVGWPVIAKARDWQLAFTYRYLERDAVLAAFTDSDFHQGGTDAKGYELKFDYGIADNTWFTLRWLSSDDIDGDNYPDHFGLGRGRLAIDTLQLDLNAKF